MTDQQFIELYFLVGFAMAVPGVWLMNRPQCPTRNAIERQFNPE